MTSATMDVQPASTLSMAELAILANTAFKGYALPVNHTAETLSHWLEQHFITLPRSYIFYAPSSSPSPPSSPVAFALMAEREDKPGHVRLASMGAVTRRQGHGTQALELTIQEERKKGTQVIELECMVNNPAGLALYKRAGFEVYRELPGWETDVVAEFEDDGALEEVDVHEVQRILKDIGEECIPWQAWDFVRSWPWPRRGYKLGSAYCVIGDPEPPKAEGEASIIKVATLFTLPGDRGQGQATRLVKAVMGRHKGHRWFVTSHFPKEFGEGLRRRVGGRELEMRWQQVQMRLRL